LVFADGQKAEPEFRNFDEVAQIKRKPHHADERVVDDPQRLGRAAERQEQFGRQIDSSAAAPWAEIGDEGLHRFIHANGGEGKISAAQPQNTESEGVGEGAHREPADHRSCHQVPTQRVHEIDSEIAAEPEEDDAAEIDVAGVTEDQIDVAGERHVDGGKQQVLAQLDIFSDARRDDESGDDRRHNPEKRAAQDGRRGKPRLLGFDRFHPPRHGKRKLSSPPGNAIKTTTNSTNSNTSVQLTGMNGVTKPSNSPSAMPPRSPPAGLPRPPSTVTTKLLS